MAVSSLATFLTPPEREMLLALKSAILERAPDSGILLYGSAARGERREDSDYDVMVIVKPGLPPETRSQISEIAFSIGLEYNSVISTLVYTCEEWESPVCVGSPFHDRVSREAVLL